ncbi:MAG TPA: hypothetical protein VM054_06380 [bacterium]|nr:hypothetical protein [bacterium]
MSRAFFVALCGALILALGFSGALAGVDTTNWYWDAALGLYISWDDAHRVFFIYDPNADAVWAYEPNMGIYYIYDQAADRLCEVGYVDVSGVVVETGGSDDFGGGESDPNSYEATLEMMRLDSGEIRRAIAEMNGSAGDKPYGDAGGFDY